MNSILRYSLIGTFLATALFGGELNAAECARCKKIEAERLAEGPQHVGYYDGAKIAHNETEVTKKPSKPVDEKAADSKPTDDAASK